MSKSVDLRFNSKLNLELSELFNEISYSKRASFNEVVENISHPYKDNLDWWVQGPASRNTFASPFFHYYCCLCLIYSLLANRKFDYQEVIVDSRALKKILEKLLAENNAPDCRVCYKVTTLFKIKLAIKKNLSGGIFFFWKIYQLMVAKATRKTSRRTPEKPIVLVDTFVTQAYPSPQRWYGSFWNHLADENKKETFFAPSIVNVRFSSLYSTYKKLRNNEENYLIKEDYLNIRDILFACRYKKRTKKLIPRSLYVLGMDISHLILEELAANRDVLTIIESLLTYRFIRRLSKRGVEIRLAIDWFEGQVIDKAWNMAFKKYYPGTKRIGYRAFESLPFYLCSYPILFESKSGVLPDVLAVHGKGTLPSVKEFFSDLEVVIIPAFRLQHVWQYDLESQGNKERQRIQILVALPICTHTSLRIIEQLLKVYESKQFRNKIEWIIKPHPTHLGSKVEQGLKLNIPATFYVSTEKSFPHLLTKADVLITEASSCCLEALACGVPVIIIENENGLTYDPIPNTIPRDLYRKTRNQEQLVEALQFYTHLTPELIKFQKECAKKIREDYFQPITKEGIDRLMGINTTNGLMSYA